MKTKTLLLTAALTAAGIASSMAQVYSVNAVGYVNVTLRKGFNLVANPLNNGGNTLQEVLPPNSNLPDDAAIQTWDSTIPPIGGLAESSSFVRGFGWDPPLANPVVPGKAFYLEIPSSAPLNEYVVTFVGEVMQSVPATTPLSNPVSGNGRWNALSSQVPQSGRVTADLGLQPATDDTIYVWDKNSNPPGFDPVNIYQYAPAGGGWPGGWTDNISPTPVEPVINVGDGFFLLRTEAAPTAWTRTFSVNPTP